MTAAEIREALRKKWPDAEYVVIDEAPQDAQRMGRKIDLLAISMWQSRGHEMDAVEIKVSSSDWARERANAEKADWWWQHAHRFWIAVPADLAAKVKSELPITWGLIAVEGGVPRVIVKAPTHTPEPLAKGTIIGLIRAAADAGPGALMRAENRGYDKGHREGVEVGKRNAPGGVDSKFLAELRAKVRDFEEASGINLDHRHSWPARRLGVLVARLTDWDRDPDRLLANLDRSATSLAATSTATRALHDELAAVIGVDRGS